MEKRDISELKELVEQINPDVIHFHTLMGIPKEFLEYLHNIKIKTVYTTHDFYGDVVNRSIFQNNQFINHGVISSEKLQREYKKIDILVVPSLWHETFGYVVLEVVLEALLEGTPCLVSDNVGAKDLVPIDWRFKGSSDLKTDLINIINNSDCIENMINKTAKLKLPYKMDKHVEDIMNKLYIKGVEYLFIGD